MTGAGIGVAAVVPNGAAQNLYVADLGTSLEASISYSLSIIKVYDINVEDIERCRLLMTIVLLEESARSKTVKSLACRSVPYWSKKIIQSIPMSSISKKYLR